MSMLVAALVVALPVHTSAPRVVAALSMPADTIPVVLENDNRVPAGTLRDGELNIDLVVQMARWFPEAADGPSIVVPVLAEEGGAPRVPAPLIRVPEGTIVVATIRNALPDSAVTVHGMQQHPAKADDGMAIGPGETRTVRFNAGSAGTYLYRMRPGQYPEEFEHEQLAGAFVVDPSGATADDRVLVINIWGQPVDSPQEYRNTLTINGRSWPHTERLTATVGDSVRWRFVNASNRAHPMHLHGFFFNVHAKGDGLADTAYAEAEKRLVVTENLLPFQTMAVTWTPEREGNWLLHCHLGFHVLPESAKLDPPEHHEMLSGDVGEHMAGLVMGIQVTPPPGWVEPPRPSPRKLRLFVQEGRRRGRAERAMSYVLQRDDTPPAPDSVEIPGSPLILTRDEPTDIVVINRLPEATGVHWHGLELESYSDGVVGWSGVGARIARPIAPADSFTARLTLRRAGTFIYHTHLNDLEQLTAGLYGPMIVLEPGEQFDPSRDHVFLLGWDGPAEPPHLLVNGDSVSSPPLELAYGIAHRFRFINMGVAVRSPFSIRSESGLVQWRRLAKDGADLPETQRTLAPATQTLAVGETYDFEFTPRERGKYELVLGDPNDRHYTRTLVVR
jgi:FtsP/CotA-like multicopper oxidase with cupredoxin domain